MVADQAERLQSYTTNYLHTTIARVITMIGFSLIGLVCGILYAVMGSIIGTVYQTLKVATICCKVSFGCESTELVTSAAAPILDISDDTVSIRLSESLNRSNTSINLA